MKKHSAFFVSFLALGLAAANALAAELGDPAATLQISDWIKGKPIDLAAAKGKNVVVVEFWATWCGPCRVSIPHLTKLQKEFKDKGVLFVGISDEKPEVVKKFVTEMGDKMDYTVAVDQDRKTNLGYMRAYDVNGIPNAFVVDKESRVVWQGHPMADLEPTLQSLVDGKFDLASAKKRLSARALLTQFFELAASGKDEAKEQQLAAQLKTLDEEIGGIVPGDKFDAAKLRQQARFNSAMRNYQQAVFAGKDSATLDSLAKSAEELAPANLNFNFAQFKESLLLQRDFQEYLRAVSADGDAKKATELAKRLSGAKIKNAAMLNDMAWTILTEQSVKQRDLALAGKLAKAAYDACDGKDPNILDTYARALFDNGQKAEAIRCQQKAVTLCEDKEMQAKFEATLKEYQQKAAK